MAKTAGELRRLQMAALSFVAADRNYRETYKNTGQQYDTPLNPDTEAACKASNRAMHVMEQAAWMLAVASGRAAAEQVPSFSYLYKEERRCACGKPAFVWSAGSGLCEDCNVKQNSRLDRRHGFADEVLP